MSHNFKRIKYFDLLFCHKYLLTKSNICAKFEQNRRFELYHLLPGSAWFSHGRTLKTSTMRSLGVEGPELKLKLYTMHGDTEILVQKVDGLIVECFNKKVEIELAKAYSRDSTPSRRNQIPRSEAASIWPHLLTKNI